MYDNTYQSESVFNTVAMVNKFAYTKQLGNWTFSPGIKFRLYFKGREESLNPMYHYSMRIPLVYLKYRISDETRFTFGVQGFTGMKLQYKDYVQSYNDYEQMNYIIQLENTSDYFGYKVWSGFGFQLEQVSFDESRRQLEEYKSSSFFLKVYIGIF